MGKKKNGGGGGKGNNATKKSNSGVDAAGKENNGNKNTSTMGIRKRKTTQTQQQQHVDPLNIVEATLEKFNEAISASPPKNKQQQENGAGGGGQTPRGNKRNKNRGSNKGGNNKQQNNNQNATPAEPKPLLVNGVELTEAEIKKLPKRKKGETKKQWYVRVGVEEADYDEDGNFLAHPPRNAQRLAVDPNDYEEEQPEEDDAAAGSETNDDFSDVANERQREYKKGGYHPVVVNELYHERYRVVHKLGWGYFSTVWLVWDYQKEVFQAMKVQKSAQHYTEAAFDEIKLLDQIMKGDPEGRFCCARMTDSFEHKGPNGTHVCMLFDLLGENLLSLGERYESRGIPLPIVKSIARETLIGLHHIHSLGIIHTDIKPENVLLSSPKHKIHSMMKRYKPPPIGERPALLERDVKTMTKSQRRRFYAKKAKAAAAASSGAPTAGGGVTAAGGGSDAADPDLETTGRSNLESTTRSEKDEAAERKKMEKEEKKKRKEEEKKRKAEEREAKRAQKKADGEEEDSDATISDIESESDGDADDSDATSETDQEWEVERFHHASLADFGNSCWIDLQFTDEVQTRQYRAPEVIIGDPYSCPIDMWSAAAMFFELLTGEFLFDPKSTGDYPRDEDHLALITELMGDLPDNMSMGRGKYRAQFYNSQGRLRHINELRYWSLKDVLHDKYRYNRKKAAEIAMFLEPMLELDPQTRATAEEMLVHFDKWFDVLEDDYSPLCFIGENEDEEDDDDDIEEGGGSRGGGDRRGPRGVNGDEDEESEFDEEIEDEEEEEADDAIEADGDGEDCDPADAPSARTKKKKTVTRRRRNTRKEQKRSEEDLAWFQEHECLQPETLAAVGLTIEDIKEVLDVGQLDDPEKDAAAQKVLQLLLNDQQ